MECKHLRATIEVNDLIGHATCPDCGQHPNIREIFNNLLQAMRDQLQAMQELHSSLEEK